MNKTGSKKESISKWMSDKRVEYRDVSEESWQFAEGALEKEFGGKIICRDDLVEIPHTLCFLRKKLGPDNDHHKSLHVAGVYHILFYSSFFILSAGDKCVAGVKE